MEPTTQNQEQQRPIKPGAFFSGHKGVSISRESNKHHVWHIHRDEHGNIVGDQLVSKKAHWWLDDEIGRPDLQNEDWTMAEYFGSKEHRLERWQLPWAWDYECWREWQPWSDFQYWRKRYFEEVKRSGDTGIARLTADPGQPFWIFNGFDDFFPETPWIAIPSRTRELRLKKEGITTRTLHDPPRRLEGSVQTLKKGAPQVGNDWEVTGLRPLHEWRDAPGYYDDEKLETITGYHRIESESDESVEEVRVVDYIGTYVIRVPWYLPDNVLDEAWKAWRIRHKPKEQESGRGMNRSGKTKYIDWLRQLGALRLLREMTTGEAISHTEAILKPGKDALRPLYPHRSRWTEARQNADRLLARYFGQE